MSAATGVHLSVVPTPEVWSFTLYVAGQSPKSLRAIANLTQLCDTNLPGRYEIEIVDLVVEPTRAERDSIIAIPTLVRRFPEPQRKIIGDLSDYERVLTSLRVKPECEW